MSDKEENSSTDSQVPEDSMQSSIARAVIGLALFAIATAGLIAVTQTGTADRIEQQIRQARSKALIDIVPINEHNNDMLSDAFLIEARELGLGDPSEAFIARQDGAPVSLILPVIAPDGYTGPIKMLMGVDLAGNVKGVRVIEHQETPGLGDKIELKKSDWIRGFDDRSLINTETAHWAVKKDGGYFDQLTGATITPRAIVRAIHKALLFYDEHKTSLLEMAPQQRFPAKNTREQ